MQIDINERVPMVLDDHIYREGFVFKKNPKDAELFDRLLIRVPRRARCDAEQRGFSDRSLEEHIQLIRTYGIEKARIVADDLSFLEACPSLNDLEIYPSYEATENFDYSVLYRLQGLKSLSCDTVYGDCGQYRSTVDYGQLGGLEALTVDGEGHMGFAELRNLKTIRVMNQKKLRSFSDVSTGTALRETEIMLCGIRDLQGIENHTCMESLSLMHNYQLTDLSALSGIGESLKTLYIDACSKIRDFSALESLVNLEILQLEGNNVLPDLRFLDCMPNLRMFIFTMNVEDGDLSRCMKVPYVSCRNRKHYNLKDKDLPKRR